MIKARNVTKVNVRAFTNCTALETVDMPLAVGNGSSEDMFRGCTSLVNVNLPKFTTASDSADQHVFHDCTALTTINLPAYKWCYNWTFTGCTHLQIVVLPSVVQIRNNNIFQNCNALRILDVGRSDRTNNISGFNSDSGTQLGPLQNLDTIIIRNNSVVSLTSPNMTSNKFADGSTGGTLYVPSSQISAYESATNWSTILSYSNNRILPIEGSIYETQYADGTPIEQEVNT